MVIILICQGCKDSGEAVRRTAPHLETALRFALHAIEEDFALAKSRSFATTHARTSARAHAQDRRFQKRKAPTQHSRFQKKGRLSSAF